MTLHLKENGVTDNQILEMNFESHAYKNMNSDSFYEYVKQHIVPNKRMYLFFDEVQRVPDWEDAVNSFRVDFNCDIYVTGSNAYMLSSEYATYLSGRCVEIKMLPLSFSEFITFHNFEIRYIEIMEPEADIEINGYHIHAFRVNHNITCYGYTVEIRRAGRFSVEHAKKREIPQKYWNRLQKGEEIETEDGAHYTPDMVLGAARKGIKVTYCTDTRPTESLVASAKNSDLLICEGMYAEKEKIAKAKQYKHMTFYEAAEVAKKAEVAEMWLTHFSPSLVHAEDYMPQVREIFPNAFLGKDGKSVELMFEDEKN